MRTKLGLVLLVAGCTSSPTDHKLPSASLTPRADTAATSIACGDAIAFDGDATTDLTYGFSYNSAGEMIHADGVYAAGGPDDEVAYTWDASGDFTGMNENNGFGGSQSVINESYDPTNGLTDYATSWRLAGLQRRLGLRDERVRRAVAARPRGDHRDRSGAVWLHARLRRRWPAHVGRAGYRRPDLVHLR